MKSLIKALLTAASISVVLFGVTTSTFSQEAKKGKRFKSTIVELAEQAPANWLLKEAKAGVTLWPGKDYSISDLPKEMEGSTMLVREAGSGWVAPNKVKGLKDGTVYFMILAKRLGTTHIGEVEINKLEKEGWKEVEGDIGSTFPSGEDWQWKAFKKEIKKGPLTFQLKTINMNGRTIIFFFNDKSDK
jgi:hypothetical protein